VVRGQAMLSGVAGYNPHSSKTIVPSWPAAAKAS